MKRDNTTRIIGLDIVRVMAMLFVFLYHTYYNMNCLYGWGNPFISQSSIFMTLFFMLSGFVLYYIYQDKAFADISNINSFWKKRVLSLFPTYCITYIFFLILDGNYSIKQNLLAIPVQLSLTFNIIPEFSYLINSGAWFISNIFLCYICFPFFQQYIGQAKKKPMIWLALLLYGIIGIVGYYQYYFKNCYLYTNAFLRIFEFLLGCIEAKIFLQNTRKIRIQCGIVFVVLFTSISLYTVHRNSLHGVLPEWRMLTIPLFALLLWGAASSEGKLANRTNRREKAILFLSKISYQFWIATFFTTLIINKYCRHVENNITRILLALTINMIIAGILYKFQIICETRIKVLGIVKTGILLTSFMILIVIGKGVYRYNTTYMYDFENRNIVQSANIKGIWGDEGNFTWLSPESEFTFKIINNHLKLKLATDQKALDKLNEPEKYIDVYINGQFISSILLQAEETEYNVQLDAECAKKYVGKHCKVLLKSKFKFIPSEVYSDSDDSRELSARLYYIGN